MKNIVWKILLIVVVMLLSVWVLYPPEEKIRLGKDLKGGVSLLYVVRISEQEHDPSAVLTQVITVLKNRVNPQGVIDISFQPQGRDRIEIVMPLPTEEMGKLRKDYDQARLALLAKALVNPEELDTALSDGTAVSRYGTAGERAELVKKLQDAFNARRDAERALETARQGGMAAEDLRPKEQAVADADIAFDELRDKLLRLSLDDRRVRTVLALPTVHRKDPATREAIPGSSPRDEALARLKQEFAGIDLDPLVNAYDAYQAKRKHSGFDDPEDLMRLLRGAGVLEFYIAARNSDLAKPVSVDDLRRQLAERGPEGTDSTTARWFPINDLKQWTKEPGQLAALQTDPVSYFASRFDLVAATKDGQYYVLLYTGPGKSMTHAQGQEWGLDRATIEPDRLGRPAVGFRLDQQGGSLMRPLTGQHVGQPMAIVLDGQVYSTPNLNSAIGNQGIIEGDFGQAELNYLRNVLSAGALQARLSPDPISINTIGPSLGRDNLERGLKACAYSAVAVSAFMIIYYFFPGFVAVVAVMAHVLLTFAIMAFISGTFTLPGLAGIALSVGMAVDANVLVYERIREEFRHSQDLRTAVRLGYQRALTAIVDGNVCNLLVCLILYWTATAEVKGFALTMICGVATTLFTSLTMTRVVFELVMRYFKPRSFPMLPTSSKLLARILVPHIDWIGLRKVFLPLSAAMMLTSICLIVYVGGELFDTEFRGGVSATMRTRMADKDKGESAGALGHLELSRSDVERRIHAIGEHAGQANPPLYELRKASIVSVGESRLDTRTDQLMATAFQIKTGSPPSVQAEATITQTIVDAIAEEFRNELDARSALTFRGADAAEGDALTKALKDFTFPVIKRTLGENISRTEFITPVQGQFGGVIVVLNDLTPPATEADLANRIQKMREQPDFTDCSGRQCRVVGLDQADPNNAAKGYTSAAIIVADPDVNYQKVDFSIWENRLAKTEWRLVTHALARGATLEQVSSFSSAVAETLKANAVVAVVLSLICILVYIWIRFNSLVYSAAAVACLVHDVIIALGLLAFSHLVAGTAFGSALLMEEFRIDLGVVAALLTLNGYSLNDTIVIMDRIRENRGKLPRATAKVINDSINQTFSRTIITSLTVFLSTLVLYVQGGTGIRPFAFCFLVGVVVGTYSSIAIAAPVIVRRDPKKSGDERSALADESAASRQRLLDRAPAG